MTLMIGLDVSFEYRTCSRLLVRGGRPDGLDNSSCRSVFSLSHNLRVDGMSGASAYWFHRMKGWHEDSTLFSKASSLTFGRVVALLRQEQVVFQGVGHPTCLLVG